MKCPYCNRNHTSVEDSRHCDGYIRRRRECPSCGRAFTTYEFTGDFMRKAAWGRDGALLKLQRLSPQTSK